MSGYHLRTIPKGVLGEISKIHEEYEEVLDAIEQGSVIMELVELSDLYGAFESYTEKMGWTDFRMDVRWGSIVSLGESIKMLGTIEGASIFLSELRRYVIFTHRISMNDLKIMSNITKRAFESGERS
jgi:hypothetical protein